MTARQQPDVSVIIVNWNSAEYVRQCLQSIYAQTQSLRLEIIVVDSASYDGCGAMLAREFPGVVFIQSAENLGFAKANNLGARHAQAANLLLLNPDTELIEDSVSRLAAGLRALPEAGAVGCRLLNADASLQTSCVQAFPTVLNQVLDSEFFRGVFPTWSIWGTEPFRVADGQPSEAQALSGACTLVKKSVFDQVNGFSEGYFMYGEDLDLCFKIRRAGYRIWHMPETAIVHFGGGSTRQSANDFSDVMMRESVYRFLRYNRGTLNAHAYRTAIAAASVIRMLILLPGAFFPGKSARALHKWYSILRWSIGLSSAGCRPNLTV